MIRQTRSKATERNPEFPEQQRKPGESNLAWGRRAVKAMGIKDPKAWSYIVLLGGKDTMAYRLRIAQSQLRPDLKPSLWSEAILVELQHNKLDDAHAIHVPLLQPAESGFAPPRNGVVVRDLADFDDPARYPNIALIALPIAQQRVMERLEAFKMSRSTLDTLEHVVRWLAFCWSAGNTGNPLLESVGLPSACMLETLLGAEGFDLTPGLESRVSCPEAIWSATSYWQDYFDQSGSKPPIGRFNHEHFYDIVEPV
ncbi:hypothetical protein [Methylobacillus flagellatus]|uniref:hypothetical protein n=1 Tax=Methylobacillus flagellatus TaxID=405 RepID=UPI0010F761A2|nr:hypothetical protein [Methylobacillus flagellatus]